MNDRFCIDCKHHMLFYSEFCIEHRCTLFCDPVTGCPLLCDVLRGPFSIRCGAYGRCFDGKRMREKARGEE